MPFKFSSFRYNSRKTATGSEVAPRARDIAYCFLSKGTVDRALEPTDTIMAYPQIVT